MLTVARRSIKKSRIEEFFAQKTNVSFSLLGGLIQGNHDNGYRFSDYKYDETEQTLEITIKPAEFGTSGSLSSQTAYVLGGYAEYFER